MNYETNQSHDLGAPVALYPASLKSAEIASDRPWGTPEGLTPEGTKARTDLIDKLVKALGGVLDVLQSAHRAGSLHAGDIQQMQRLELWYSELQAEKEHIAILTKVDKP